MEIATEWVGVFWSTIVLLMWLSGWVGFKMGQG